jgi:hypothetical protein
MMSLAMGGECWTIPDNQVLKQTIENVMGAARHPNVNPVTSVAFIYGLVINFEEKSSDGTPLQPQRQMIFTQSNYTHFPIPESYWVSNSFSGSPV